MNLRAAFCSKATIAIVVLLAIFLTGCTTVSAGDRKKANLYLELGTSYLIHGDYPLALKALLRSEHLDPTNASTENNLGLTYYVMQHFDQAQIHFKKALQIRPDFTEAENNLGRLYIDVGLYKKAIYELKIATADLTYTSAAKAWSNLGQAYFLSGEFSEAEGAFRKSLQTRHDDCSTLDFYGRTLFELHDYRPAAESLDQAIGVCGRSKFDEPHFYSGMSFYKLGDIDKARARLNELVSLFPQSQYAPQAKKMLEILK